MPIRLFAFAFLCLLPVFVSGCQANRTLTPEQRAALKKPVEAFKKYDLDAEQLRESLQNKTVLFYDSARGTRVAYYSAEGREFLWYPLRKQIAEGDWKTEKTTSSKVRVDTNRGKRTRSVKAAQICFKHKKGSYNPVTGNDGGQWECRLSTKWLLNVEEKVDGDVFNLASGKTPFRLNKRKATIEELKSQCKTCKSAEKKKS